MRQTDTIRRLQRDDLATQAVLRYQQDMMLLDGDTNDLPVLRMLRELAAKTLDEGKRPTSVAAWIALVMFAADTPAVIQLREAASKDADAVFVQAERWLERIDDQHARKQAQTVATPPTPDNNSEGTGDDGRRGTP